MLTFNLPCQQFFEPGGLTNTCDPQSNEAIPPKSVVDSNAHLSLQAFVTSPQ
jgi:hypothetical protein